MKNTNNKMLLDYIDFTPNEFEELMQQPRTFSKEEERLIKIKTDKKVKEVFASLGY
jgi:ornithine carbamoyltransferase